MQVIPILFLLLFSGCMDELENVEEQIARPKVGMLNYPVETLSGQEMALARSFCDSLAEKELTFPRNYLGATIVFTVRKRECSEDKSELEEAVIKARLGSDSRTGYLRYFPLDYYLPLMTEIETANQGVFSEYCPDILLNVQKTNSRELDDGKVQIFRFIQESETSVMAQVLTSEEAEAEVSQIQEFMVFTETRENRPRGLVARKVVLQQCGNLEGNENSSLWSQQI